LELPGKSRRGVVDARRICALVAMEVNRLQGRLLGADTSGPTKKPHGGGE
jgi:hypothetical protein